jgi:hypothetical protein
VQCSAVQSSTVQSSTVQCSTVQCSTVQCSLLQCSAVQFSAVQHKRLKACHVTPCKNRVRACEAETENKITGSPVSLKGFDPPPLLFQLVDHDIYTDHCLLSNYGSPSDLLDS